MTCARVHIETHRKHLVWSGPTIDGCLLLDVSLVGGGSWGCGRGTMVGYGGDTTYASAHSLCTFPFSLPIVHWVPPDRPGRLVEPTSHCLAGGDLQLMHCGRPRSKKKVSLKPVYARHFVSGILARPVTRPRWKTSGGWGN